MFIKRSKKLDTFIHIIGLYFVIMPFHCVKHLEDTKTGIGDIERFMNFIHAPLKILIPVICVSVTDIW